jgi:hypothetical protein
MTSLFIEQSPEEIGSAIFSFTSHTAGKREERRKTDRKAGKERRKAEKTLGHTGFTEVKMVDHTSAPTIWCIGRNGHWGNPVLDDKGCLICVDYCVDCQQADIKFEKWLKLTTAEAEKPEYEEWDLDTLEALEEQRLLNEQKLARIHFMEEILLAMRNVVTEDDYIPEIDDDYDF